MNRTILHQIGDLLRDLFVQVPPGAVKAVFVLLYVILLIWVIRLPRERVTPPEGEHSAFENLKIWAALAIVLQILIYLVL